jgi:hypothetical protein
VRSDDERELFVQVSEVAGWRDDAVTSPNNHGRCANLALGAPADVVLVKPLRNPCRFA